MFRVFYGKGNEVPGAGRTRVVLANTNGEKLMLELPPAKFPVGATVQVKRGTTDPDFLDIPLGGWAGTIREIDQQMQPPVYLVTWNGRTLDHMDPVVQKRCEREGLDLESMWL